MRFVACSLTVSEVTRVLGTISAQYKRLEKPDHFRIARDRIATCRDHSGLKDKAKWLVDDCLELKPFALDISDVFGSTSMTTYRIWDIVSTMSNGYWSDDA